ncbi:MAG TPA: hypothetical protein DDZ78_11520 [Porphyromonadaceae bacterium]|nr:hypothetical protein [Porphyromonadaceae bacterium]
MLFVTYCTLLNKTLISYGCKSFAAFLLTGGKLKKVLRPSCLSTESLKKFYSLFAEQRKA